MNAKIIIVVLCAAQLAAGFNISSITSVIEDFQKQAVAAEQKLVQDFKNGINSTVTKALEQVDTLKSQIQQEFQNQVAQFTNLTQDISECTKGEEANVTAIFDDAKQQITAVGIRAGLQALPVVGKINSTINDVKNLTTTSIQQAQDCTKQSIFVQLACFAKVTVAVTTGVEKAKIAFAAAVADGAKVLATAGADLAKTTGSIVADLPSKGQAIIADAIACIKAKQSS